MISLASGKSSMAAAIAAWHAGISSALLNTGTMTETRGDILGTFGNGWVLGRPTERRLCAAAGRRGGGEYFAGGAVRAFFLPAHRPERALQHAADAHRLDADVKRHRAPVQFALGLGRAIALAQIVEPGRTVIALGP